MNCPVMREESSLQKQKLREGKRATGSASNMIIHRSGSDDDNELFTDQKTQNRENWHHWRHGPNCQT